MQFTIPACSLDVFPDVAQVLDNTALVQNMGKAVPANIAYLDVNTRAGNYVAMYCYGASIEMAHAGQAGNRRMGLPFESKSLFIHKG